MTSTKHGAKLLWLVPLGVGLLAMINLAPQKPGVERRPAVSLDEAAENLQPGLPDKTPIDETSAENRIDQLLAAELPLPPARLAVLETVLLQGAREDRFAALRELGRMGDEAIGPLSLALADKDRAVRQRAVEILRQMDSEQAVSLLASHAAATSGAEKTRAIEALAAREHPAASNYLELALYDADPEIRELAIEALADIGDEPSITLINQALRDEDVKVRERAAELLDELNDEAQFHALYPRQPLD